MSYSLSAEIWVGIWSPAFDEDKFDDLYDFCEDIGLEYCCQYDSQEEYFVGIKICSSSDWGNAQLDFDKLKEKELEAKSKLSKIPELEGYVFETQMLPCYF